MEIKLIDGRKAKLNSEFKIKSTKFYNQSKQHSLLFKIESLIYNGIIYPHEIIKRLSLSRRDIGVCLKYVYGLTTEKYFGQVVSLKCKNTDCDKNVCYDRCTCEYQYYCSRRCTSIVTTNSESFKKLASAIGKETCKKINASKEMTENRLTNLKYIYSELMKDESFKEFKKEHGRICMTKQHLNPEFSRAHSERSSIRLKKQNQNPIFKDANSARGKERMTRLQKDPEFQKKLTYSKFNTRFEIHGLKCSSSYEKRYIENLHNQGLVLPKICDPIKTPYGFYSPDFDHGNFFIEIKCNYTYEKYLGSLQEKKLNWVNDNVKPVKLYNLDDAKIKEELQLN